MPLARLSAANGRPWRKLQFRQTTTPTGGKGREAVLAALLSRNQPSWLQCWLRTVGRGPLPALAGRKLGAGYRARASILRSPNSIRQPGERRTEVVIFLCL